MLLTTPTAFFDRGVTMLARAVSHFRRDAIDAAVRGAAASAEQVGDPQHEPGAWTLSRSGGSVGEVSLAGVGAPAGVIGRWYRSPGASAAPRPVVVVVHGYNAGDYALEERLWPRAALARKGVDVVLYVMPGHGVRKDGFGLPAWPNPEGLVTTGRTIDQAVRELRGLLRGLAADPRVSDVAVWGMSLGSYVGAIAASQENVAAFAGVTPLMSLPAFFRSHDVVDVAGARALEAVFASRAPAAGRLGCPAVVVAADGDGVTGIAQARAMARWAGAETVSIPGSHLAPFGLSEAFNVVIASTMAAFAARALPMAQPIAA